MRELPNFPIFGVDVSKGKLDIFFNQTDEHTVIENTPVAIQNWIQTVVLIPNVRVAFESTGHYTRNLQEAFQKANLPYYQLDPSIIVAGRYYCNQLAKNDKLDAELIANAIEDNWQKLHLSRVKTENEASLLVLHRRRAQLVEQRKIEKCHLEASSQWDRPSIERNISHLDEEISLIADDIEEIIASDHELVRKQALYQSMPGIGAVASASLICELPELGELNRKKIAKLAGVAPITNKSGTIVKKSRIRKGRSKLRTVLYMAALSAIRCNPVIKAYYKKMKASGKPTKVAIIACVHKMLNILGAMVKSNQPWDPQYS